jgi:UDP:flavonoid glycosyltransferase YjiC (YdhE family)
LLGLSLSSILVVTWAPGGNLPPLLAAASLLRARGHAVTVLGSAATRPAAEHAGFEVLAYRRSPDPDTGLAFERQARELMALAAGPAIALDVRDVLARERPALAIVDCMLPAGVAAALATGTRVASLVHFPYGLARRNMSEGGGGWTTDLEILGVTHRCLGLPAVSDGLTAWEAAHVLLVSAPSWFDLELGYPANVVHAGPLGVTRPTVGTRARPTPPRVLLSFSTTVMEGQTPMIQRVCDALELCQAEGVLTLGPGVDRAGLRIPRNVEVVSWGDHDKLLRDCSAVITHGGLGTTLRALAHGVPLVVLPLGRDQAFNATRVAELGVGTRIASNAAPAVVASALERVLSQADFGAAASAVAARITADEPDRRAADVLEPARGLLPAS